MSEKSRAALDSIRAQVTVIKRLQDRARKGLKVIKSDLLRETEKLKRLVARFPKKDRGLYEEKINQITERYL